MGGPRPGEPNPFIHNLLIRNSSYTTKKGLWRHLRSPFAILLSEFAFPVPIPAESIFPPSELIPGHNIFLAVFVAAFVVSLADTDGLSIYNLDVNLDFFLRCHITSFLFGL